MIQRPLMTIFLAIFSEQRSTAYKHWIKAKYPEPPDSRPTDEERQLSVDGKQVLSTDE
jgi:hypothetical protein